MSQKEVDETEGTLIDIYMIALQKMNEKGDSGGKREDLEIRRALGME